MSWPDDVDQVLAGDITAALAYLTPAGGAVVTPVAPIGLRDRDEGTVTFTTSLGFGRKLERIQRDPHVALAYHAREHGFARKRTCSSRAARARSRRPTGTGTSGCSARRRRASWARRAAGCFWDRWLREYYADRVPVTMDVTGSSVWPGLDCSGAPEVLGAPRPEPAGPQAAPKKGAGPRVDALKAGRKLKRCPTSARLARGRRVSGGAGGVT